jgi:pyruvate,water dikinase
MQRISWFKDIHKGDIPTVGGKSANLGEMYNIGLPVPPGFVVTADTYKEFIEKTGLKNKITQALSGLDVEDTKKLQEVSEKIQQMISYTAVPYDIKQEIIEAYKTMNLLAAKKLGKAQNLVSDTKYEEFVAVRSSATAEDLPDASFAGQQASFLNVKGSEPVLKAVRDCWASLFTSRAIYYREKNNFQHMNVFIAVVVQKMVNSAKSGVMFTANPATNNRDEIIIEAVYGLGEAIVSGSVNPNHYVVDKKTLKLLKAEMKKQDWGFFRDLETGKTIKEDIPKERQNVQNLKDIEVEQLAKYAKAVDEHYGKPQDMEWAIERDTVYIVQSRPITTLNKGAQAEEQEEPQESEVAPTKNKVIITGMTASPGIAAGKVCIVHDMNELDKVQKGDVMVTQMTNPDMVPAMAKAIAIVTDEGGMTCHAAIVSREMGIPCIVGTEKATSILKEGQIITVDATHATVFEGRITQQKQREIHEVREAGEVITGTEVKVIMDLPKFAEKAAQTGADGIGLVRMEFMIALSGIHPAEFIRENKDDEYTNMLAEGISQIAKPFTGKPVWVRTSDIRTDEYRNLKGGDKDPKETDPMIGWHGIRRALDEPRILKAEFKAIKKVHEMGLKNVGIMLPFIIRVEEVKKAKEYLREIGMEPSRDVDFGIMVETPAACWIIEDLCKEGIDFVSFGTNDLTQMTLGIDRNNEKIAKLFDEMHPAVLGEIHHVIKTCKRYHVKTSICGQAGSRPKMAEFLVKAGIDSISANPDAVHTIREIVARTEQRLLLDAERLKMGF